MIGFSNHYKTTIWIAFQWFDKNCQGEQWRTEGWFQFEPGESNWLNLPALADLRQLGNSHFYYYIQAADGAVWAGPYQTYCPNEYFSWCLNQSSSAARLLGFREIVIQSSDYFLTVIPGDLSPTITVHTEKNELGGRVTVIGDGFTPFGHVSIYADNLAGAPGPQELGYSHADVNEHFEQLLPDIWFRCDPVPQRDEVIIRVTDDTTGGFATGVTSAFVCPY